MGFKKRNLVILSLIFLALFHLGCSKKDDTAILITVGPIKITLLDFSTRLKQDAFKHQPLHLAHPPYWEKIKNDLIEQIIFESLLTLWNQNKMTFQPESLPQKKVSLHSDFPDKHAFRDVLYKLGYNPSLLNKLQKQSQIFFNLEQFIDLQVDKTKKSSQKTSKNTKHQTHLIEVPEKIKLQQILLPTASEANLVHQSLLRGTSFDDLATKYSQGPEAASKGHLGWINKGVLKAFDAAFKYPSKKITPPIQSSYGFHIFKILDKKKRRKLPSNEVKRHSRDQDHYEAKKKLYTHWLEEQLLKYPIFKNESALSALKLIPKGH